MRKENGQVFNPYLPDYEYIPDAEPYVFDGRLYVFGSHDRFGAMTFCENDYVTWSAPVEALSEWRYEGVIFRREQDPLNREGKYPLFAPDVQRGADGRYYLYYAPGGTNSIGVAVSDSPAGPYEFLAHVADQEGGLLGRRPGDGIPFDPGTFLDDDGTMYLYYGFAPMHPEMTAVRKEECAEENPYVNESGPFVVRLAPDMHTISVEQQPVDILECSSREHDFFEASSMRKIDGRYYFIYSSQNSHELCYAVGSHPAGPFYYGGVLHSNGDIGYQGRSPRDRVGYSGNNHGSLVQINGQWYIFGHRMTNYMAFSRQGIAEPVTIREDGSIEQAEMTSCGLNGGPLEGHGTYPAACACVLHAAEGAIHYDGANEGEAGKALRANHPAFQQDGEDREDCPDQHIVNMRDGAVAGFKYFRMQGAKTIRVSTRGSEGLMLVSTSEKGEPCGEIRITEGEWWHESAPVGISIPDGVCALYFTYRGEGAADFLNFTLM